MPVRVLVVDDSSFFRRRIIEILSADPRLNVIGEAVNGAEAIEKAVELDPDVITMDIEMPIMDGISSVREIMKQHPCAILMFSSLTTEGAQATLDALEAGALDFLPKRLEEISGNREEAIRLLRSKVFIIGAKGKSARQGRKQKSAQATRAARKPLKKTTPVTATEATVAPQVQSGASKGRFDVVAIGTSTGGPVALQEVLTKLPKNFPVPIILVQHMPGSFTPAFAQRLNQLCSIEVKEAQNGDILKPGHAYLAPGGKQMETSVRSGQLQLTISKGDAGLNYRPSVDVTFNSLADALSDRVLAVILTGMGADGREGARSLKQQGSEIWAQDEASCVVYGMPSAVAEAKLTDRVLALSDIGDSLKQGFC
ncbi:MAG: chemotaxis response regulator protein-glutamate methylesterase [Gammaproteobacteria bacterium]|nr:chemotaxis response regulator protein-glutamate methylesterase [Gammaproteobacteria bacterium]